MIIIKVTFCFRMHIQKYIKVVFLLIFIIYILSKHQEAVNLMNGIMNRSNVENVRRFTDKQLAALYETEILSRINDKYLQRYHGIKRDNVERLLPTDMKLKDANKHLSYERFFIMRDFQSWIQKYNITCKRFASINGPDPEDKYITCSESKRYYQYKEGTNGNNNMNVDFYVLNLEEKQKIDFWNIQQTLEHIYDGQSVLRRLYDNSECGGHIFVSVPIYNIPHLVPLHFYGYTPMGIVTMVLEARWKIMDLGKFQTLKVIACFCLLIGLWGNREYLIELLRRKSWPTLFDALNEQEKTNYTRDFFFNDPFFGFQVWLLANKMCSA
jgi:hypothetical protein